MAKSTIHLVKRAGHREAFDSRKVYASVYAACLTVRATHEDAELHAEKVTEAVKEWLEEKDEVTTSQISRVVTKALRQYDPDASYIYGTHRDVS